MKIVYLDFDDLKNPLLGAGQARATYEVARRLVKKGHSVTVISSRFPGYKDRTHDGIVYKHIGLGSKHIRFNNAAYILAVPFAVRQLDADIIIECFTAPISTLFSPVFTKIPVVALPSMFNAAEFAKKYRLPFHWIEKFGLRFYKYIAPYSEIDCAKAKKLNPRLEYRIIPEGVGGEFFAIRQGEAKHILFLGRFDIQQKGIDILLKAYAKVVNKIHYPLVLAGHGPDEKKIRRMIEDLNLEKHVKIVGPAYGKKKFRLISETLYVAFPSRHEEMSLWALEALVSGLPLVRFDIPEFAWATDAVSLKAKPFDIDEYAKVLVRATEPKLIHPMRKKSREFARKYTWERVANEFESFVNKVLDEESETLKSNDMENHFLTVRNLLNTYLKI